MFLAASIPRVPRLIAYIGSIFVFLHQVINSFNPNSFVSLVFHARSSLVGLSSIGPIESSQLNDDI